MLYSHLILCYYFSHIDLGVLAVSGDNIKTYLTISDSELGLLATGTYIGNVAGSLILPVLFQYVKKTKYLILGATLLNAFSVCLFAFT